MQLRFLLLLTITLSVAHAGEPIIISAAATKSPWRVGAGYAHMLGLKTKFTGLGTFRNPNTLQSLGSGFDRDYDNGFVYLDSSRNEGGETWNWSFDDDSQHSTAGTGSMNFSITNSLADASASAKDDSNLGMEFFAMYDMGAVNFLGLEKRQVTWGFRMGLQYNRIAMGNGGVLLSGLTTTTDNFSLNGTIPPLGPYTGSFGGPGPLLGDNPLRGTALGGTGLVSGNRELDIDLTLLNFGSYLEIPVTEKFHTLLEGGVSLGIASGSYNFRSITSLSGIGTQNSQGNNSSTELLPGVYLGLGASYQLNEEWSLIGSGRYQYLQSYDLSANGSQASISFDSTFVLSLGAVYSF